MSMPPLDPFLTAFAIEAEATLVVIDAQQLPRRHVPPFPPDLPALIVNLGEPGLARAVAGMLSATYPEQHKVRSISIADEPGARPVDMELKDFPPEPAPEAVFVPPLTEGHSFEAFQEVIARLRAPDGCPWDMEQTHLSLRKHLMEESYEALAAMDAEDPLLMREEYGDLLLQIVLNAQIAYEAGEFRMADVLKGIHDKIIRRHPHVFGDLELANVGEVLQNWERLKAAERSQSGNATKSLMDSLPAALPALSQAQEYQARASRVGFAWKEIDDVLNKIAEEISEVRRAEDEAALTAELGDLFFALANLARWKDVDAEAALREANARFKRRFAFVERAAREQARAISDFSTDELVALWQEAKHQSS